MTPGTIVTENVGSRPSTGVALPPKYEPKTSQSDEEATDPLIADHRNFYKVDVQHVVDLGPIFRPFSAI